ncbi:hypothetical protein GCM10009635_07980 [Actinocatenispora thailandica]
MEATRSGSCHPGGWCRLPRPAEPRGSVESELLGDVFRGSLVSAFLDRSAAPGDPGGRSLADGWLAATGSARGGRGSRRTVEWTE